MQLLKAADLKDEKVTALVYAPPGFGKTTLLGRLPGRTLIVDVESGTSTLVNSNSDVDIVRLSGSPGEIRNILTELQQDCPYDNVCIDSLSELERWMLGLLGQKGNNGGAPHMEHYKQVNFNLLDIVRQFRALRANLVMTAWEEGKQMTADSGEKYTRAAPQLSGKSSDNICGLCDIVGQIVISTKEETKGERFIRLTSGMHTVAKDRIKKRQFCKFEELI